MEGITEFKDEYRWLSNFWYFEKPLVYQGLSFPTNEHFYVAMKTKDYNLRKVISDHPLKGLKKFGRSFEVRTDWEDIKIDVMSYGLKYKFSNNNPILRYKLIETGDKYLSEGNYWNDTFWGVDLKTGGGYNHLGKLLMDVRETIRKEDSENE